MSASTAVPFLVFSRYFLSQMSWEAGCIGISRSAAAVLTASRRTVLMPVLSPFNDGWGLGTFPPWILMLATAPLAGDAKARRRLCPRPRFQRSRRHGLLWIPAFILLRNGPSPEGADR